MQTIQNLKKNITQIAFPNAKEVLIKRLKSEGSVNEESIQALSDNSIAVKHVELEIEIARMALSNLLAQIPLLLIPITIPIALQTVQSQLPSTLKMLDNLEVPYPDTLEVLIDSVNKAEKIQEAAKDILNASVVLSPLGSVLGL